MHPATSKFLIDVFGPSTEAPVYFSSLTNSDAPKGPERHLISREFEDIETWLNRWDRPDRGSYFTVSTVGQAADERSLDTIREMVGLHADIDFKNITATPDEVDRKLKEIQLPPSKVINSGHGRHAYWLFREKLEATPENIERIKALLRLLKDHVGGDPMVCHPAALMRLPGTCNTKFGERIEVTEITDNPAARYEIDELEEWLTTVSPIIQHQPKQANGANGHDGETNPWLAAAGLFGHKAPIDVEQRLAAMAFGAGENGIHATQVSVTAALLNRGQPVDEVVEIVLAATRAAAGAFGERWNWTREERAIRGMCETWLKKHPEVLDVAHAGPSSGSSGSSKATGALTLKWHGEVDAASSRAWLVSDLLPETGKGLISGQSGFFKSFIALDLAAAVMAGATFANFPAERRGGVLFIAAEGASEIPVRLEAVFKTKYPEIERMPFAWAENCPRLLDRTADGILAATAQEAASRMRGEFGLPLVLILIDTVVAGAGFTKSGDENDAATGQIIMNCLERVSQRAGALVLGIDHFGKSAETGTRGTSAKEASADVVLAILGNKSINGTVTDTRLAARKRRGGPSGEEFRFSPRTVPAGGVDRYGKDITSVVIDWHTSTGGDTKEQAGDDGRWSKSMQLLRRVLMNILVDHGQEMKPFPDGAPVRAVDIEIVRAEFHRSCLAEGDTEPTKQAARRKAFYRAMTSAQERSLVGIREIGATTFVWLAASARDGEERAR